MSCLCRRACTRKKNVVGGCLDELEQRRKAGASQTLPHCGFTAELRSCHLGFSCGYAIRPASHDLCSRKHVKKPTRQQRSHSAVSYARYYGAKRCLLAPLKRFAKIEVYQRHLRWVYMANRALLKQHHFDLTQPVSLIDIYLCLVVAIFVVDITLAIPLLEDYLVSLPIHDTDLYCGHRDLGFLGIFDDHSALKIQHLADNDLACCI